MSDRELPEEQKQNSADTPAEPLLDRRTAIAQARAIRREAAALEQEAKAQAAETANTILENAEPEPPRKPLHNQTEPHPVSNATGKFVWLAEMEKPAPRADADEIVAQLLAETEAKSGKAAAAGKDTDALVDQIIAEAAAKSEADPAEKLLAEALVKPAAETEVYDEDEYDEDEYDDDEYDDEYDDDEYDDDEYDDDEYDDDEYDDDEYDDEEYDDEEYDDDEYDDDEYDEDEYDDEEYDEDEYDDEVTDENPANSAEDKVLQELRRLQPQAPVMSEEEAEAEYEQAVKDAKPFVKKAVKKSNRAWKKEASAVEAKRRSDNTASLTAKINIGVCLTMLFGVAAGMLFLERPTVSWEENRNLATMPEFTVEGYLDGSFTGGVQEFYDDTVPYRSEFKNMTQNLRKHMGISGGPKIIGNAPAVQEAQQPAAPVPEETTTAPETTALTDDPGAKVTTTKATTTAPAETEPAEEEQEGELSNNILIVDKRGIMLFGGWEGMGINYATYVNRFKQDLPYVNMYSMVVPTVCSFYTPDEFQYLITSEKDNIDYINNTLESVTPVDAYSALEKHKDEPIYMRTDHHWSGLGAFYAAEEFSAVARVPFARIDEYEKHERDGYVGTLYGYSNDITLKENPETFVWYTPKADYTTTYYTNDLSSSFQSPYFVDIDNLATVSWYLVYMVGDDHMVHINTEVKNGRRLAVIKDSYGNALIPWLTSSFEDIYVIDMRYFKANAVEFMKNNGVTDVLFCMNTFSANGGNAEKIETIRVQ